MCEASCAVTELRGETGKETEGERDSKRDEEGAEIENGSKMDRRWKESESEVEVDRNQRKLAVE